MVRLLAASLALLACTSAPLVSSYETFVQATFGLAYGRPADATDNSTCGGNSVQFTHPENAKNLSSPVVVNVTAVNLPVNAEVVFSGCSGPSSTDQTVNASDPTTWLVVIPSSCVIFKQNTPLDCSRRNITIEYSLLSDYCKRSTTAAVCGTSSNSSSSTPAATSAAASAKILAWTLAASAIAAFASFV